MNFSLNCDDGKSDLEFINWFHLFENLIFRKKRSSKLFAIFLLALFGFMPFETHAQFGECAHNNDDAPPYSVAQSYDPTFLSTLEIATAAVGPGDDFCIGNDPGKDTQEGTGSFLFTGLDSGVDGCGIEFCFSPRQGCGVALGNVCLWQEDPNNPGTWLHLGAPSSADGYVCVVAPPGVDQFSITISRPGQGPVSINDLEINYPPTIEMVPDQVVCTEELPAIMNLTDYEPEGQTGGTWSDHNGVISDPTAYLIDGDIGDVFDCHYTFDASASQGYDCMISADLRFTIVSICCQPTATCNISDINEVGCEIPAPFTNPMAVFAGITACGKSITMDHVDTEDPLCDDGYNIVRTYRLYFDGVLTEICEQNISISPPALTIQCPENMVLKPCCTEQQIIDKYELWKNSFDFSGGCIPASNINEIPPLPAYECGAGFTLEFTYQIADLCFQTETCTRQFVVEPAVETSYYCPDPVVMTICEDQAVTDQEFQNWVSQFTARDGCNLVVTYTDGDGNVLGTIIDSDENHKINSASLVAPDVCDGGTITINLDYTEDCGTGGCSSTFTVPPAPQVNSSIPLPIVASKCTDQNTLNTQFADWISGFEVTGGCDPQITYTDAFGQTIDISSIQPPDVCVGGSVIINCAYTDLCSQGNGSSSFTVPSTTAVTAICPDPISLSECTDQSDIDQSFENWINGFIFSGGCDLTVSFTDQDGNIISNIYDLEAPDGCTGGSVTIVAEYSDLCDEGSCSSTFTVEAAPLLVVRCPDDEILKPCCTRQQIQDKYDTWVDAFSYTGGCDVTTNKSEIPSLPPYICGAGFTLEFAFIVSDECGQQQSCSSSFIVEPSDPVSNHCPQPVVTSSCLDQTEADILFDAWVNEFIAYGGCDLEVVYTDGNGNIIGTVINADDHHLVDGSSLSAPDVCEGGSFEIILSYTDLCGQGSCSSTFTVPAAPAVVYSCPAIVTTNGCEDQATVNDLFDTWINGFSVSGGCDPKVTYTDGDGTIIDDIYALVAPDACLGGAITVELSYTDLCSEGRCASTFTVPAAPGVVFSCPDPVTTPGCEDQTSVNNQFNTWIAGFSVSGGCDPKVTYTDADGNNIDDIYALVAPDACLGGSVTIRLNYTDLCSEGTCASTFTVPAAPPVVYSCPSLVATDGCEDQATVNDLFDTWINGFSVSGGCDPKVTYTDADGNNIDNIYALVAPDACLGGSVTIRLNYTDLCSEGTCASTFTVPSAPPVVYSCPALVTTNGCEDQATVNDLFDTWINGFSVSGGCDPKVTYTDGDGTIIDDIYALVAPDACLGGSITVELSYTDLCSEGRCASTFTVPAAPGVVFSCPDPVITPGCEDQTSVNTQFNTWISGFVISGGCDPVVIYTDADGRQINLADLVAPDACLGGSVTVNASYSDLCGQSSCASTFAVPAAPAISFTCPDPVRTDGCEDQDVVDAQFDLWISGFSLTGGCAPNLVYLDDEGKPVNLEDLQAPDYCRGGTISVFASYDDLCSEGSCSSTFTVPAAPPVVYSCPASVTTDGCENQATVNDLFDTWINGFSVSGGCDPKVTYTDGDGTIIDDIYALVAPDACLGGSITVELSYTDLCSEGRCASTFTVPAAPGVVFSCPDPVTTPGCEDQTSVNTQFNTWISGFVISGGCDPVVIYTDADGRQINLADLVAPDACLGGSVTVNASYSDLCGQSSCASTFTVPAAPAISFTCPDPVRTDGCEDQDAVDAQFDLWISGFSLTGGCAPNLVYLDDEGKPVNLEDLQAPDYCRGGTISVFASYDDLCSEGSCSSTFTVPAAPPVVYSCPASVTTDGCQDQATVNDLFDTWINGFSVSGGCDPKVTYTDGDGTIIDDIYALVAPDACLGGSITVELSYTDLCSEGRCASTFTVPAAPGVVFSCPDPVTTPGCEDQTSVNTQFNTWISGFAISGGCDPVVIYTDADGRQINLADLVAPDACIGGSVTVNASYSDLCGQSSCASTFTVPAAPAIAVSCPAPIELLACSTADEIENAYNNWVNGFSVSGGCHVIDNLGAIPDLPLFECGKEINLSFDLIAKGLCDVKTCGSTFKVLGSKPLEIRCPSQVNLPACSTQEEIENAYAVWISGFGFDFGCNPVPNIDEFPPVPEFRCGEEMNITIQYAVSDDCTELSCVSTFKVDAADPVNYRCPSSVSLPACSTEQEIANAFAMWRAGFALSGGCNTNSNIGDLPDLPDFECGKEVDLHFKLVISDDCGDYECESTFYVAPIEDLLINCPADELHNPGNQALIDANFDIWKNQFNYSGGCNTFVQFFVDEIEIDLDDLEAPHFCGGKVTVKMVVLSDCEIDFCESTFEVKEDVLPPVLYGVPADSELNCNADLPKAPVVTAIDPETGEVPVIATVEYDEEIYCNRRVIRTWTAMDACGHVTKQSQTITFVDGQSPTLTVPDDITISCDDPLPAPTYEADDNCSDVKVELAESIVWHNECEYTLTRTWTAKDRCWNWVKKSQVINVVDEEGPQIKLINMLADMPLGGSMEMFGCDNVQMNIADAEVTDNCCSVETDVKDELIASGVCDIFGYYRKWKCSVTATDAAGNVSEYYFYVLQYDNEAPAIIGVPEDITLECGAEIPAADTTVYADDDCSQVKKTNFDEKINIDPEDSTKMEIVRTWWAVDECGNRGEGTQVITVCGFDSSDASAAIGNTVWADINQNGLQDEGEFGLNEVTVNLYEYNPEDPDELLMISSTKTSTIDGKGGQFTFDRLQSRIYKLQFMVPENMEITLSNQGDDDLDSDANPTDGMTDAIYLEKDQILSNVDAGFYFARSQSFVDLANFEANSKNCVNTISWTTNSEFDLARFEVEFSKNGNNYSTLKDVESKGGISSRTVYSFNDPVKRARGYYRLKMIALNGEILYSEAVRFSSRCADDRNIRVFPNPFSKVVKLDFTSFRTGVAEIFVTDRLGKIVKTSQIKVDQGQNQEPIDLDDLPSGTYIINIRMDDWTDHKMVIKSQ